MKLAYLPQVHYIGDDNYLCITAQLNNFGQELFRASTTAWKDYSSKMQQVYKDICHKYGFTHVGALQIFAIYREWGFDMRVPVMASEILALSNEKVQKFVDELKMAIFDVEMYCTFDKKEAKQ